MCHYLCKNCSCDSTLICACCIHSYVALALLLCTYNAQIEGPSNHPLLDDDAEFQAFIRANTGERHRFFDGRSVRLLTNFHDVILFIISSEIKLETNIFRQNVLRN